VFTAVATPIVVVGFGYGYAHGSSPNLVIVGAGVLVGLLVGILAGRWVSRRGGKVWKDPRL
jgi:hypothetical protein